MAHVVWNKVELDTLREGLLHGWMIDEFIERLPNRSRRAIECKLVEVRPHRFEDVAVGRIHGASAALRERSLSALRRFANDNKISEADAQTMLLGPEPRRRPPGSETPFKTTSIARLMA